MTKQKKKTLSKPSNMLNPLGERLGGGGVIFSVAVTVDLQAGPPPYLKPGPGSVD